VVRKVLPSFVASALGTTTIARSQEGGEKEGETDAANLRSLRFLL
jgi:hypothetical protein